MPPALRPERFTHNRVIRRLTAPVIQGGTPSRALHALRTSRFGPFKGHRWTIFLSDDYFCADGVALTTFCCNRQQLRSDRL